MNKVLFTFLTAVVMFALGSLAANAQTRSIERVSGDLYLFRNNSHIAVFLVTKDGIIATDPINESAAQWLEAEIAERFNKEIRYAIYSHSDADHVSGGSVFADTATIVAHENAAPIIGAGDYTAPPNVTFKESARVSLGGREVVLHYFGPSHTDNVIVMEFPEERAIFVVDSLNINRMPYRNLPRFYMPELINFIRRIEAMDFDVAIPGHGAPGGPADVARYREYLEALYAAVQEARASGLSLEQAQETITLEAFADFDNYDAWLSENIEGVYRILDDRPQ